MRRLALRALALVWAASVVAVLASFGLAYFSASGSGSAPFAVDVAGAQGCVPLAGTSASASTLDPGEPATATSDYDSGSCEIAFDFGIPRGADGAAGETGPAGPAGADSTVPGPQGVQGEIGPQGVQGVAGVSVTSSAVTDCNGTGRPGSSFTSVSGTTFACDGAKGDTGATGATGATGSQGPQGQTGPQGPPGMAGVEQVFANVACSTPTCSVVKACPAGKLAIGGGFNVSPGGAPVAVQRSEPSPDPQTWTVSAVRISGSSAYTLWVNVTCAAVAS